MTDEIPGLTNATVPCQTSMEVVDERSLLIYQKAKFDDFTVTTKFKLVEGVVEQMAGIVFRYQDEKDFMSSAPAISATTCVFTKWSAASAASRLVRIFRWPGGEWAAEDRMSGQQDSRGSMVARRFRN